MGRIPAGCCPIPFLSTPLLQPEKNGDRDIYCVCIYVCVLGGRNWYIENDRDGLGDNNGGLCVFVRVSVCERERVIIILSFEILDWLVVNWVLRFQVEF